MLCVFFSILRAIHAIKWSLNAVVNEMSPFHSMILTAFHEHVVCTFPTTQQKQKKIFCLYFTALFVWNTQNMVQSYYHRKGIFFSWAFKCQSKNLLLFTMYDEWERQNEWQMQKHFTLHLQNSVFSPFTLRCVQFTLMVFNAMCSLRLRELRIDFDSLLMVNNTLGDDDALIHLNGKYFRGFSLVVVCPFLLQEIYFEEFSVLHCVFLS